MKNNKISVKLGTDISIPLYNVWWSAKSRQRVASVKVWDFLLDYEVAPTRESGKSEMNQQQTR